MRPTRLDSPTMGLSSLLIYTMPPEILVVGLTLTLVRSNWVALACLPHIEHTVHVLYPSKNCTTQGNFLVSDQSSDYRTTCRVHLVGLSLVCHILFCTPLACHQGSLMSMLIFASESHWRHHVTFWRRVYCAAQREAQYASWLFLVKLASPLLMIPFHLPDCVSLSVMKLPVSWVGPSVGSCPAHASRYHSSVVCLPVAVYHTQPSWYRVAVAALMHHCSVAVHFWDCLVLQGFLVASVITPCYVPALH